MRRLFGGLSLVVSFVLIPALCFVEYLTGVKMGMYRYVFMKNAWLLEHVFTPDALPFLWSVSSLLLLAGIYKGRRPAGQKELHWHLWRLYGAGMLLGGLYLFDAGRFTALRAGPWFGLALLAAEGLWLLRAFLP